MRIIRSTTYPIIIEKAEKSEFIRKGYLILKAIVLDMYGVIVKQTGDDFVPHVQQTFPNLKPEEIYTPWFKADVGELTSLEVWESLGFKGDLEKIEKDYLDTIELNDDFLDFASSVSKHYKMAIISNDSSRWSKYLREKFQIPALLQ
ncbi:MAG: HAD-superfamily hydrolase, subfamily variant 3 [Herbinix sp.]|jgi:putative hydrolase of the HAD superfamily|nr:HAD-superfamily hydrolase, subfamily variant 3 [Herbinix sp.]